MPMLAVQAHSRAAHQYFGVIDKEDDAAVEAQRVGQASQAAGRASREGQAGEAFQTLTRHAITYKSLTWATTADVRVCRPAITSKSALSRLPCSLSTTVLRVLIPRLMAGGMLWSAWWCCCACSAPARWRRAPASLGLALLALLDSCNTHAHPPAAGPKPL